MNKYILFFHPPATGPRDGVLQSSQSLRKKSKSDADTSAESNASPKQASEECHSDDDDDDGAKKSKGKGKGSANPDQLTHQFAVELAKGDDALAEKVKN